MAASGSPLALTAISRLDCGEDTPLSDTTKKRSMEGSYATFGSKHPLRPQNALSVVVAISEWGLPRS
jgi:hypothetical protein